MRVLFVISTLRMGGAERVCALMASKFSEFYDVVLAKFDDSKPFYELNEKVSIKCLNYGADELGLVGNLKKRFGKIFALRKLIKEGEFDGVISFLDSTNLLVLMAIFGLKTPIIISEHTSIDMPKGRIYDLLKRLLYPNANALSVLTKSDATYYAKFCKNTQVIYNPFFAKSTSSAAFEKENLVIFVGRLIELKNCEMFVKVAANFKDSGYKFIVAGNGELLENLQNLSNKLGANVQFLGNVSDIKSLYMRAKFLLSTSNIEGLGNALIEAIAYDVVRISTKTSGACELMTHEFDGILCELNDISQMSYELKNLMQDEQKCAQICANAKLRLDEFSMEKIYADWLLLLQKAGVNIAKASR